MAVNNKEKLADDLNNKIKELNDYIQVEYGYDPAKITGVKGSRQPASKRSPVR